MRLFHGTSRPAWEGIQQEGVQAPSYWGTYDQALEHAHSFGGAGLVLEADLDPGDLEASLLMAQAMLEEGDLDVLPSDTDLAYSLDYLGGLVCKATVQPACVRRARPMDPASSSTPGRHSR